MSGACQNAFNSIKEDLLNPPVLSAPIKGGMIELIAMKSGQKDLGEAEVFPKPRFVDLSHRLIEGYCFCLRLS